MAPSRCRWPATCVSESSGWRRRSSTARSNFERPTRNCVPPVPPRDLHALTDNQRLKQVLVNLIVNGVKYNRPGGRVTLTAAARGDDTVRIEVADTGTGIEERLLARLFTPFERLGATEVEGS